MPNQQLAEELHKQIIRNFEKRIVHSSFIDNGWGANLSDMQLIKEFVFCCVLLMFIVNIHGLLL